MKSSTQNTDTKRSGVKGSGTKSSDIKNSGTRSSGSKKRKGKRRKKRLAAKIILTSALLLFFLGCIYLVMSFHYKKHFLPGTVINGIDCKGLTVEEVKEELQESISQYTLTIYTKEDTSEVITGDMLGLTYSDDKGVEKLMEEQNPFAWILSFTKQESYQVAANITYEKNVIPAIADTLSFLQAENITAPADAYIQETDTGWVIVPEIEGNTVKRDSLIQAIEEAIDSGVTEIDLAASDLYEKPSILSTDEKLNEQLNSLNLLISANITYDFEDNRIYTVDGSVIKGWLVQNEDGTYSIDEEQAAAFVKQMAYDTDTFGLSHEFKTTLGPTITLARGGDYGWVINRTATTEQLIEAIKAGTNGTLEPIYRYSAQNRGINDIGGTYVEICIEQQKMWCYKDGQLVVETNVVTGCHNTGYDTPSGCVWAIDAKKKNATFKLFNVDVTFWLPFNDQVGIHDASWRSASEYVPSTYISNGSHGCINTPYDAAEKIFNVMEIGYPVIVYYSTSQPVGPQPTQSTSVG